MTTTKITAMMRIRMAVMMKMASVGKCNKGPMLGKRRKKQFADKNYFLKDLKDKTFATGCFGCFDKDK